MQMEPTMSPEENLNSTENQGEEKTPSVEENISPQVKPFVMDFCIIIGQCDITLSLIGPKPFPVEIKVAVF